MSAYLEDHALSTGDREAMLSLIENIREKLSMLVLLSSVNQISLSQLFRDKLTLIYRLIDVHGYENVMPVNFDGDNAGHIARLIDTFDTLNQSAEKLLNDIDNIEHLLVRGNPAVPRDLDMN